jgi:hypothetical protein
MPAALTVQDMTRAICRSVDGPHSEADTEAAAWLAAEAIRYLSYATQPGRQPDGMPCPATAYAVLGALSAVAARLPQVLFQVCNFLDCELAAGRLGDDSGASPHIAVERARRDLETAACLTPDLVGALVAAQADISGLHARTPNGDQ